MSLNLDPYIRLMQYHRGAMESRRTVQFRVFTGTVAVLLLIGNELPTIMSHASNPCLAKGALILTLLVILCLFWEFIDSIESITDFDQTKYSTLQNFLWTELRHRHTDSEQWAEADKELAKLLTIENSKPHQSDRKHRGWGSLYTKSAVLVLTLALAAYVLMLK